MRSAPIAQSQPSAGAAAVPPRPHQQTPSQQQARLQFAIRPPPPPLMMPPPITATAVVDTPKTHGLTPATVPVVVGTRSSSAFVRREERPVAAPIQPPRSQPQVQSRPIPPPMQLPRKQPIPSAFQSQAQQPPAAGSARQQPALSSITATTGPPISTAAAAQLKPQPRPTQFQPQPPPQQQRQQLPQSARPAQSVAPQRAAPSWAPAASSAQANQLPIVTLTASQKPLPSPLMTAQSRPSSIVAQPWPAKVSGFVAVGRRSSLPGASAAPDPIHELVPCAKVAPSAGPSQALVKLSAATALTAPSPATARAQVASKPVLLVSAALGQGSGLGGVTIRSNRFQKLLDMASLDFELRPSHALSADLIRVQPPSAKIFLAQEEDLARRLLTLVGSAESEEQVFLFCVRAPEIAPSTKHTHQVVIQHACKAEALLREHDLSSRVTCVCVDSWGTAAESLKKLHRFKASKEAQLARKQAVKTGLHRPTAATLFDLLGNVTEAGLSDDNKSGSGVQQHSLIQACGSLIGIGCARPSALVRATTLTEEQAQIIAHQLASGPPRPKYQLTAEPPRGKYQSKWSSKPDQQA